MSNEQPVWENFKLYRYDPSLAGNIIFVVLFSAVTVWHIVILARTRTWYFIPFVVGCAFEAIGYVGRAIAANEAPNFTLNAYILQNLLILLGPALMAASIYMVLGRLIRLLDAHEYALIRTTWMTKIFVTGDVLSFLTQGGGGGLMAQAKTRDSQKLGESVVLGGLGIQIFFFGFFMITTVVFHARIAKNPTPRSFSVTGPWRRLIYALYASSVLILVRSIFRMIEFGMGNDSVLMSHEVYLLVLDGLLMFAVAAILLWSHPSKTITGYRPVAGSLESGRNTAESFHMLPVTSGYLSPSMKPVGLSDSDGASGSAYPR